MQSDRGASPRRVYVDVDDVLAETTREIAVTVERLFGRRIAFEALHSFDLGEAFGLDASDREYLMREIHRSEWLERLPPLPGARDVVRSWRARGAEVRVMTGRPASTNSASIRWLERHEIPFSRFDSLDKYARHRGTDADHSLTLAELGRLHFDVAVEDSLAMAVRLADGIAERVFLMDRPWNRDSGPIPAPLRRKIVRVESWDQIETSSSRSYHSTSQ